MSTPSYSKKLGIVGKPNTGKSTFFSAATLIPVDIGNYPFTTIAPNIGMVAVPDRRLEALERFAQAVDGVIVEQMKRLRARAARCRASESQTP